jgi:hypothetical protein
MQDAGEFHSKHQWALQAVKQVSCRCGWYIKCFLGDLGVCTAAATAVLQSTHLSCDPIGESRKVGTFLQRSQAAEEVQAMSALKANNGHKGHITKPDVLFTHMT